MINKTPAWKYFLLALVIVVGILFALPNLYGDFPAVQISPRTGEIDPGLPDQVEATLTEAGLQGFTVRPDDNRLLVLFEDEETQLQANDLIDAEFGGRNATALNLVPATPGWLRSFAQPMYLGLDLRGGVHFLMEVDMVTAMDKSREKYVEEFRTVLRQNKIRFRSPFQDERGINVRFTDAAARDEALALLRFEYRDLEFDQSDAAEFFLHANLTQETMDEERRSALQQNIVTLRNRVNELGVAEPIIQQQGRERIVVQLPGVQDTTVAKEILGATATLEYRMVYGTFSDWANAAQSGRVPANTKLYRMRDDGSPVLLQRKVIVTGDQIKDASSGIDTQSGSPAVFINLDGAGAKRMQSVSQDNIGNPMAVVFIENRVTTKRLAKSTSRSAKPLKK